MAGLLAGSRPGLSRFRAWFEESHSDFPGEIKSSQTRCRVVSKLDMAGGRGKDRTERATHCYVEVTASPLQGVFPCLTPQKDGWCSSLLLSCSSEQDGQARPVPDRQNGSRRPLGPQVRFGSLRAGRRRPPAPSTWIFSLPLIDAGWNTTSRRCSGRVHLAGWVIRRIRVPTRARRLRTTLCPSQPLLILRGIPMSSSRERSEGPRKDFSVAYRFGSSRWRSNEYSRM